MYLCISSGISIIHRSGALLTFVRTLTASLPFREGDTEGFFEVLTDVTGPFFVYANLKNFYGNSRRYMDSIPDFFSPKSSQNCGGKCNPCYVCDFHVSARAGVRMSEILSVNELFTSGCLSPSMSICDGLSQYTEQSAACTM